MLFIFFTPAKFVFNLHERDDFQAETQTQRLSLILSHSLYSRSQLECLLNDISVWWREQKHASISCGIQNTERKKVSYSLHIAQSTGAQDFYVSESRKKTKQKKSKTKNRSRWPHHLLPLLLIVFCFLLFIHNLY